MIASLRAAAGGLVVWAGLLASSPAGADFALTMYLGDMNRAGAGRSTASDQAAAAFNNPAAMSAMSGGNLLFDSQLFLSSSTFADQGSTDAFGAPLTGGAGGDAGANTFVPGVYYAQALDSKWSAGLTINAPFGLSTSWEKSWKGRYQAVESGIETVNINPSMAFRVNANWSLGAGISAQYASATLSNAIDFGAVCLGALDPAVCAGIGLGAPQAADGFVELDGTDWSYGFNLGLLYSTEKTRVGFSYRSSLSHSLEGKADFTTPPPAAAFAPLFTDTNATVDIDLPDTASLGVAYQATTDLAIMGDVLWTGWSRVEELRVKFENAAQPDVVLPREWKDTVRLALGLDYRLNPAWRLQGGTAYAPSAIPDENFDPSIPVTDAYWLAIGAQYSPTQDWTIGFGWNHILFETRDINHTGIYGDTLRGQIESELDVLGLQLAWKF